MDYGSPRRYFEITSEPIVNLRNGTMEMTSTIQIKVDEIARETIERIRGKAKAIPADTPNRIVDSYRCLVCGEYMHSSSGYVPLFCQRCGRLLDYSSEEGENFGKA
jgi:hypothetical protein